MYVFCMSISCLLSSGMKLEVRKFRNLIEFGFQGSVRVSSILLYFISIRAWVANADLFLYGQKGQHLKIFGEEGHFSKIASIQTIQYPLLMFLLD